MGLISILEKQEDTWRQTQKSFHLDNGTWWHSGHYCGLPVLQSLKKYKLIVVLYHQVAVLQGSSWQLRHIV